jgi:prolipoprotein diacylglyceryltransferase
MAGYGLLRFSIEWFRGDVSPVLGPLHASHLFSLTFIVGAGLLWWTRGRTPAPDRLQHVTLQPFSQE